MLDFKYSALTPFLILPLLLLLSSASEATPTYSDHYCTPGTVFTPNSTFQSNLNLLLSSVSSNASLHNGFYRTTISPNTPNVINGLFLCRGDVNATVCQDCVTAASEEIIRRCPNQTESIIWYDVCMLRYSNNSFNNIVPGMALPTDGNNVSSSDMERFNDLLASFLNDLAAKAANSQSEKKFATGEMKFTTSETIYGLAQCVPDLSSSDCNTLFQSAIGIVPTCCTGKLGAMILLPGANIRYEPYTFYNATDVRVLPPSSSGKSNTTVIVAIVVTIVGLALFLLGYCYLRRRASKKQKAFQEDSIVDDLQAIESLQFDLATIEAATNMFSDEKRIGRGGFGMVYKGTLPNGQEIAVKRLSESSMQVLEIVSGKRNSNFYQSNLEVDLLSYAWKTWTNGTPLQLLDPSLGDSYPRNEVIRCIHIGLLCVQENPADRPSMATVALMLNSYSLTMSNPRQPPSFLRERTTIPDEVRYKLDSGQSSSTSFPLSLNEASITELYPR
ncbi:hypothetical protein L6164_035823 [Bauhinia variegata]|uniref:Uncharacterized protein n=1 Tax=Bauhinia variegata TaxID=167791 RepID=A0ACB9KF97_BAUVA|nr:hypothetical protein L6164_035823 [Bauhinia variegata]